jgi:hypothetical protein
VVNQIEAMKQALEALEKTRDENAAYLNFKEPYHEAITTLRTAIEEAEKQEPVAWLIWLHGPAGLFENKQFAEHEFARRNQEYPDKDRKLRPLIFGDTTPPAAPVHKLQCFHCQDTIETLNDKVMHLMAQREWLGLTDEDKRLFSSWLDDKEDDEVFEAIEAKLREKNHHG